MPHPSNTRQKLPLPGVTTSRGRYPLGGRFGPPGQLLKKSKNLALTIIRPSHTVRTGLPIMIGDSDVMARRMLDGEPTIVAGALDAHSLGRFRSALRRAFRQGRGERRIRSILGLTTAQRRLGPFAQDRIREQTKHLSSRPLQAFVSTDRRVLRQEPRPSGPLLQCWGCRYISPRN
jgi:hypothetical protein